MTENPVFWSIIVAPPPLIVRYSFSTLSSIVKCNSGNLKSHGVAWPSKARWLSPTSTSFPTALQNCKQTKCKRDVSAGRGPLIVIIVDRARSGRGGYNDHYQNKTLPGKPFPWPRPIAVVGERPFIQIQRQDKELWTNLKTSLIERMDFAERYLLRVAGSSRTNINNDITL